MTQGSFYIIPVISSYRSIPKKPLLGMFYYWVYHIMPYAGYLLGTGRIFVAMTNNCGNPGNAEIKQMVKQKGQVWYGLVT